MKLPRDLSGSEIKRWGSDLVLEAPGFDLVVGRKSEIVREAREARAERLVIDDLQAMQWQSASLARGQTGTSGSWNWRAKCAAKRS